MAIELITGHAGTAHVSSADVGAYNAGTAGSGRYVLGTSNGMSATMEDANTLVIATGDAIFDGRHVRITSSESVTIDSGAQNMQRKDIVGIYYSIENAIETATVAVYKGTPVASGATDPTLPTGNILEGATTAFMPLYRITLNGITPNEPEQLFNTLESLDSLKSETNTSLSSMSSTISGIRTDVNTLSSTVSGIRTDVNALSGRFLTGTLNSSYINIPLSNNQVWMVTLQDGSSQLIQMVYEYASTAYVNTIEGSPVATTGRRWGCIAVSSTFGIYSENRISIYSATRLA